MPEVLLAAEPESAESPPAASRLILPQATIAYTSAITTNTTVWTSWNVIYTQSTTTGSMLVDMQFAQTTWATWNMHYVSTMATNSPGTNTRPMLRTVRQPTDAEREELIAAEHKKRVERVNAKRRARRLLISHLTPEQRAEYEEHQHFTVVSETSERRYRVRQGQVRNIEEIDVDGRTLRRLCVHPRTQVPDEDAMLCQAIMLQHQEADMRRIANYS